MTVSLTGATGFVGQAVLDVAAQVEEPVRALTRRPQAGRKHVDWIAGDLSNPAALARLCDGTDAVIHVAGLTTTPDPADFEEANVAGTERLIAAAELLPAMIGHDVPGQVVKAGTSDRRYPLPDSARA